MAAMTSKGQMTFRKEFREHLGARPGEELEIEKVPGGRLMISRKRPTGDIRAFIGALKGKSKVKLTIEEINQVIADGWAGKLR